ncbi:lipoprotein [Tardiphaga sp.]|uniref:LPS translocon maturation chaperone LptM n=1 Tax=Tardiphaga sp. TaxID=1926292 RepID=UPI00261F8CF1|nr:lipoprotein [Tardiphaga sp.]
MNRSIRPASSRWAFVVLTVSALALAGCGRKGGLDLPPQSSAQPLASSAAAAPTEESQSAANKGSSLFAPSSGVDDAPPAATKGRKKPFLLDPLLD